ncbi:alpha/beta hydrolase fold-domain-containing protein [Xylariomycetidae sp. FL2044]|nr:alpha/beta hydrolase fold-domain-containing protein [Xylariomycetidae sp. FL2044]
MSPYTCTEPGCLRTFKRPEHLSRHRLNHQPRKIHRCLVCQKDFVRLDLLQRHNRRHDRGMTYRNSGGYSTRGRPQAGRHENALVAEPSSPSDSAGVSTPDPQGQGQPMLIDASSTGITDDCHEPERAPIAHHTRDNNDDDDSTHVAYQLREQVPTRSGEKPTMEPLTFFGSNDPGGLTQDLDWLFGASPWDMTAAAEGLYDSITHADFQTTPNESMLSLSSASTPQVGSAYQMLAEKVTSTLTFLPVDVLNSTFFEPANLESCMESYWKNYNPHFCLLHQPTFSLQDAPPLLIVALLTLGATLSRDEDHYMVAEQIHQNLRWLIFTSPDFQAPAPLWVVQALLVVQAYEKMFSTRKLHEMSHIFHYSVITLMRRGSFYSSDRDDEGDSSSLDKAWHRWVERESSYRAAYFAFIMDAQHWSIFGHNAALSLTDFHLPLPCAEALWDAPTATAWNREQSRTAPSPYFLPEIRGLLSRHPIPYTYSPYARFVLLHGLISLTRHMVTRDQTASCISVPENQLPAVDDSRPFLTPEHDHWKDRLDHAINTWSFSLMSQTPSICLEAARPLQRIAHVSIHVSLMDFHVLAGAPNLATGVRAPPGSLPFTRAYKRISEWASHSDARKTLRHCLLMVQETMFTRARYSAAEDNIILRPWILYNTTLILWAYGAITEYLSHMLNGLMGDGDISYSQGASRTIGLVKAVGLALDECRWELLGEAKETLKSGFCEKTGKMASQTTCPAPPYPLHDSVKDLLDPEYVKFYNKYLLNAPQVHYQPVAASRSGGGKLIPGGTDPVPVGKTVDFQLPRKESAGPDVPVRVFIPPGSPPSPAGWPVFQWYHGGGWVLGNIDSENSLCTNLCVQAKCVVITTDYRLAPEDPFPAAVHDAWETVLWVVGGTAASDLDAALDLSRLCVGGSSAGGNLAAIMTQKALGHEAFAGQQQPGFKYQILVVPVTDNTATTETSASYKTYEHTAALPVEKMLWYRRHYLPNEADWSSVEASPLLADSGVFAKLPPALVVVAGLDVLRWEGEEYARRLRKAGVEAEVKVIEGVPHPFVVMDAVLEKGRDAVKLLCDKLAAAF